MNKRKSSFSPQSYLARLAQAEIDALCDAVVSVSAQVARCAAIARRAAAVLNLECFAAASRSGLAVLNEVDCLGALLNSQLYLDAHFRQARRASVVGVFCADEDALNVGENHDEVLARKALSVEAFEVMFLRQYYACHHSIVVQST